MRRWKHRHRGLPDAPLPLLWFLAACVWWALLPRLLGLVSPWPPLALGGAFLAPLLMLQAGAWVVDGVRSKLPGLARPTPTDTFLIALMAAAFFLPRRIRRRLRVIGG